MGEFMPGTSSVQREYDWSEVEPVVAVLEAIAVFEHGDATGAASILDPPLPTYIETDALNTMVRSEGTTSVGLRIADYHVQIHRNTVEVSRADF